MHHPTDRIIHTTAFVTPVVVHWLEREIAQWDHPMKDRSDDPTHHERTLLARSYISLPNECRMLLQVTDGRVRVWRQDKSRFRIIISCGSVSIVDQYQYGDVFYMDAKWIS